MAEITCITPKNRIETLEAWACVPEALLLSGIELGGDLGRGVGAKVATVMNRGFEAVRRWHAGGEAGAAAVSMSMLNQDQVHPEMASIHESA